VLAGVSGGMAHAQITPPGSDLPWNKYLPQRITDGYTPILGLPGTTRIGQGTDKDSKDWDATKSGALTLPFTFRFVNQSGSPTDYTTCKVMANGAIAFGTTPPTSGTPDLSTNQGYNLIMPYWSDVAPVGTPEGGVYWRVDGTSPSQIVTIEWRVQGVNAPTRNPGDFQAKLYEGSNKIIFYYGSSSIDRNSVASPTTYGAAVGLKANGVYYAAGSQAPPDYDKFLLILNPDVVRDTVALTRTRAGIISVLLWGWYPTQSSMAETYAMWPVDAKLGGPSRYWHYSFPTLNGVRIGYQMSPVDNDVAADSLFYNPKQAGNAYIQNAVFEIQGRFRNNGALSRGGVGNTVPVQADIYRGTTLIESRTGNAFPTATTQGGTSTVIFAPTIGPPTTTNPGTYTIKLYPKLANDQDRTNDTLTSTFYISWLHDFLATDILDPKTFTPSLPSVYPVGSAVPIESRFLNIGTAAESNIAVGYTIYDGSGNSLSTGTATIRGTVNPLESRDVVMPSWTPTAPGDYYIKVYSLLDGDQQNTNDTVPAYPSLGRRFTVRYEIEVESMAGTTGGVSPIAGGFYPDGRPISVIASYRNNGIVDAANVPARIKITGPGGNVVYNQAAPGSGVTVVPGAASGNGNVIFYDLYPKFVPNGPGTYCVESIITDPQDLVRANDTARYCFTVKARLNGTIYVGIGERFQTIQEANDSLFRYGVSGPVNFKLVNDSYVVRPTNTDTTSPALDARGDIIGSGPNSPITWMAVDGKTDVKITLKSPSGIGIIYGQRDTLNPTGYVTWDGGPNRILHFVMDTVQAAAGLSPLYPPSVGMPSRSIPFFFSQGSSNFAVKNCRIDPVTVNVGLKTATSPLPIVLFNRQFSTFTYSTDNKIAISTGILLRNSAPADVNGVNPAVNGRFRDTLINQNNVFSGNVISNFGFGIVSIGAGPLRRTLENKYVEFNNQNNSFINNTITDVARAGVVLSFEKGSDISNNTITRVANPSATVPHAAGIWVSSGGYSTVVNATDTLNNRGYSSGLSIERNKISAISSVSGNGAGIWIETTENVFTTPDVYRFPALSATNNRVWNNMVWNYRGRTSGSGTGRSFGIGMTLGGDTRVDYVATGNKIDNNTIFNQVAGTTQEYGIYDIRGRGSIRNNIISVISPATTNPIGLFLQLPNDVATTGATFFGPASYRLSDTNMKVDYNLYWVPNGAVGALSSLSTSGYNIPSPPVAKHLNQWRALTGLDMNSVEGNIVPEFISITPGSENLHINPSTMGSLVNNRGINIAGMTTDIDGDPRGSGFNAANYDIGADEVNTLINNNDLAAEDIIVPFGYQATAGQYSDAEYIMADSTVMFTGRVRNVGGLPIAANTVTAVAERWNGAAWVSASGPFGGTGVSQTMSFNTAQSRDIAFGAFRPQTLREVGLNDPFYGLNPNISPLYRLRITSSIDGNQANNTFQKIVRFYLPRSTRRMLVSVEQFNVVALPATPVLLSNKLNTDSLIQAMTLDHLFRADGLDTLEDYDVFERDKWPVQALNFNPWRTVVWEQGSEPQGLEPEERVALKAMLNSRTQFDRAGLILAGQDVLRIHDVSLSSVNGATADQDFVRNYLRAEYRGFTKPTPYDGRTIRGAAITPGKQEMIQKTAVAADVQPTPALTRTTTLSNGIARATHYYEQQQFGQFTDSAAGVASAAATHNVVFYAIDWRHFGRLTTSDASRSGAQRVLLGGLDFINQFGSALPIKVVTFGATPVGKKAVRVDWTTSSEISVASLEIERATVEVSEQGEREGTYSVIDRESPAGTAARGARYSTIDQNVQTGVTYRYRLVSVGLDGSRSVDAVDQVKILSGDEAAGYSLSIVPNPVSSQATISVKVPANVSTWSVELYDIAGRLVKTFDGVNATSSNIDLDVADLASGAYTLRLNAAGVKLVEKMTVQK